MWNKPNISIRVLSQQLTHNSLFLVPAVSNILFDLFPPLWARSFALMGPQLFSDLRAKKEKEKDGRLPCLITFVSEGTTTPKQQQSAIPVLFFLSSKITGPLKVVSRALFQIPNQTAFIVLRPVRLFVGAVACTIKIQGNFPLNSTHLIRPHRLLNESQL